MAKIFALDIGTRKVAGIIADIDQTSGVDSVAETKLRILDCEILEHQTRAMLAGQIHDVEKVAQLVKVIKDTLEQRTGEKLNKVAVAVAGRVLKTLRAKSTKEIFFDEEIKSADIFNLEMEAVQKILGKLSEQEEADFGNNFYCVGYSVVSYKLDGQRLENLIGQKGTNIEVEIIITFLPRVVLESMFSVLKRANLEVSFLTLEPIAAINVIIPPDMRRINLALVDIGAGTSDIAITEDGSITNYGMVTYAGDEITEKLCERYLVDFSTGEYIKKHLTVQDKIVFNDIFGKQHECYASEVVKDLLPHVTNLANKIANEIIKLNQKIPCAVVCVGGGSRTFYLEEKIAEEVGLSKERVGTRGPEMIMSIVDITNKLKGPEAITPLGIAVIAGQKQGLQFINVTVNGKKVHLLNMNQHLNVLTALVAGGINTKKLYAKPGVSKTYEIGSEIGIIKGTLGKPAVIKINEQEVRLDTFINEKDEIIFEEPQNGKDGQASVGEIAGDKGVTRIIINNLETKIIPDVFMNKEKVTYDTEVVDRAKIEIKKKDKLPDILKSAGFEIGENFQRRIIITVNGQPRVLTQQSYSLWVNGKELSLEEEFKINDGDIIDYQFYEATNYKIKDVVGLPKNGKSLNVKVNNQNFSFPGEQGKIFMNGREVSSEEFIPNGADVQTVDGKDAQAILVDIFRFFSLKLNEESGKKLKLLMNGQEAKFTSLLQDGSEVEVYFE